MYNMKPTFEFYDLPFAVKKLNFHKKNAISLYTITQTTYVVDAP